MAQHGHHGDLARRAFDAIAAAQQVADVTQLNSVFAASLSKIGFSHFLGATAAEGSGGMKVDILFGHNHQAWEEHYQARAYAQHDAVLHEMLVTGEPLFWSDLDDRHPVPTRGSQILNEAHEFGFSNGFATPMFNLDGSISTVLMMGQNIDQKDPDVRASAHVMSMYYGSVGRRLQQAAKRAHLPPPRLSPRQLECLKWARAGKSSTDIGDILGLSSDTVNEYLAIACARLGVRTRVQAVAEAALFGILEL